MADIHNAVTQEQLATVAAENDAAKTELRLLKDLENSVESGFQMAAFQGPLCSEPVVGMAWIVESLEYKPDEEESEQGESYVDLRETTADKQLD